MDEPFLSRHARLLAAAHEHERSGLLLYSSGVHSFIEMDTVWYATGFKALGPCGLLLVPGREPVLHVELAWETSRASEAAAMEAVTSSDLFDDLGWVLRDAGLSAGDIGVCGVEKLSRVDAARLTGALGEGWQDFDEPARQVGVIKDEDERDLVRRATWIAEEGYRHALEEVRPGMREFEFAGRLDVFMRELGADDNFLIVSASQHNLSVHAPGDRILVKGDLLLAEISPSYKGAFAQICRTAVIGEPSKTLIDGYELLRGAYARGLAACRPGNTMGAVVEAVNEPIADAGFEAFCRPPYMRTRGHGMGIGSPFPISVKADSPIVLREGMTFVLHPNQYLPPTGYLMCGDHVAIGASGAEPLSARLAQLDCAGR